MIGNRVKDTLQRVYSHPAASTARRTSGEGYADHEAHREIDLLQNLKAHDSDGDGKTETFHPGHSMAVPSRRSAEWQGCPQNGVMHRVDGLFLTPDTSATPTFETLVETQFHPDGVYKREVTLGGEEVVARTLSVHHTDPSQNYVEEFRLAR